MSESKVNFIFSDKKINLNDLIVDILIREIEKKLLYDDLQKGEKKCIK